MNLRNIPEESAIVCNKNLQEDEFISTLGHGYKINQFHEKRRFFFLDVILILMKVS